MVSKVIISPHAQQQLENYVLYVLLEKKMLKPLKASLKMPLSPETGFLILQTISGILMTKTLLNLATEKSSSNPTTIFLSTV